MVAAVLQELVEQVTIGAMHVDAVEAGSLGVLGAATEILDDAGDLARLQSARHDIGTDRTQQADMAGDSDGRGRDRQIAAEQFGIRNAAHMPELRHHPPAGGVNGIGDLPPAFNLGVGPDAGRA
mgnify:CR=1 FL=1